jgi:hypothetical protein
MARGGHQIKRERHRMVPLDQMVPADPVTLELPLSFPEPLRGACVSTRHSGSVAKSGGGTGGYWDRATGCAGPSPVGGPAPGVGAVGLRHEQGSSSGYAANDDQENTVSGSGSNRDTGGMR